MKQLIEDYERRIITLNSMIKSTERISYPIKYARLEAKLSCYRTFLAELERIN